MERFTGRMATLGATLGLMIVGTVLMAGSASATPADPGDEAFADLLSKTNSYGALAIGVIVAGVLVLFAAKWVKRGANKA